MFVNCLIFLDKLVLETIIQGAWQSWRFVIFLFELLIQIMRRERYELGITSTKKGGGGIN